MPDITIPKDSISSAGDGDTGHDAADAALTFRLPVSTPSDRLDKILAQLLPQHSRSRLQGWITDGFVHVNDQVAKVRQLVGPGDIIHVQEQAPPESLAFTPEPVEFAVVAESPDWIVINKPAGLVTHPGAGNWQGTLLNGLLYRYPELARVARAGIVHRLDKDTSGLLVVARNETAQTHLVRQLQARSVHRLYRALAHGRLMSGQRIEADIGRDPKVPVRMTSTSPVAPKPAVTHVQPLRHGCTHDGEPVTEVACRLETGRTHQIRVHLSALGHPLLGDTLYSGRTLAGAGRQMLHALELRFEDPSSAEQVHFSAEPPVDFQAVCAAINWELA